MKHKFSIVIPVFNRPAEIQELLESLNTQTFKDFEVIIVEDGSTLPCKDICDTFKDRLDLHYYTKSNSGPGLTRNFGVEKSCGDYVVFFDSDCLLPPTYFEQVNIEMEKEKVDAFGGPDKAHQSFSKVQKAISYSMTSFFTTGGIRGGKNKLDIFYPRTFNMGINRQVFISLGGFSSMRFGEDIDFSTRIIKCGYNCKLFPNAWVWHKRRTDMRKFFRQVHNSGIARINQYKRYPQTLKLVHLLPAMFTIGLILIALGAYFWWPVSLLLATYILLIFLDAAFKNRSIAIGLLAVKASFVQLIGYGTGFLRAWWKRCILRQGEFQAFKNTFYK